MNDVRLRPLVEADLAERSEPTGPGAAMASGLEPSTARSSVSSSDRSEPPAPTAASISEKGSCRGSPLSYCRPMPRGVERHPDKDVNAALDAMVEAGWRIERPSSRSAHAWAKAFCPHSGHREHLDCAVSVSGTPRSGGNEARRLRGRIRRCQRIGEGP